MKQENIKKVMEQVRSKQMNVTKEESVNTEASMLAMANTADYSNNHVTMTGVLVNEWGDMINPDGPHIGFGFGYIMVTQVEVNIAAWCASTGNNLSTMSSELYLQLSGEGIITTCQVDDENMNYKATIEKVNGVYNIPLSLFKTGNAYPDTVTFHVWVPNVEAVEALTYEDMFVSSRVDLSMEIDAPDYEQHYLNGSLGETSYRVNLRTGRLDISKNIKTLNGNKAPLSLNLVYNPYTKQNSFLTNKWKLNVEQKIVENNNGTLSYVDANFRTHTFKPLSIGSLYYDTDHTGMLIRKNNGFYTLTDDSSVEMFFDSNHRLSTVKKYNQESVTYMDIEKGSNYLDIRDGMGREVRATQSTIGTAALTYNDEGDLIKIEDSQGETVNYAYDDMTYLVSRISVNNESLEFVYDEEHRIHSILYKVGTHQVKKQAFSYLDTVTQVSEIKYPDKGNQAYTTNCYKFDVEGKLIATFEKEFTEEHEKILNARYYSPDRYENYTINLDPQNSVRGEYYFYDNAAGAFVGRFNSLPLLNPGEKYVMFVALDRKKLFSGIANGNLEIWLDDGSNDITKIYPAMQINANTESGLPYEWMEVTFPGYVGYGFVQFAFIGNSNVTIEDLECVYLCKTTVSTQRACMKTTGTEIAGEKYVEKKGSEEITWTEIDRCTFSELDDCLYVSGADFQLTKRNEARASGSSFIAWYNDLKNAVYIHNNEELLVQLNNEGNSRYFSSLTWANVQEQNVATVYEYVTFHADGSMLITQNKNKGTDKVSLSYIDPYGRTYKTVNSKGVTIEKSYDDYDRVTSTMVTSTDGKVKTSTVYMEPTGETYREIYTDEYGKTWTYVYTYATGDLESITDPKGNKQSYKYDTKRRSIKVEQSTSENTLEYTTNDQLSSLVHDTGTYAFSYDEYNRISNVKYQGNSLFTKGYTVTNTNDTATIDYANGDKMSSVMDKYGNLLSVKNLYNNKTLLTSVYDSIMANVSNLTERAAENKNCVLRKKCHQTIDNPYNVVYNYDILKRLSEVDRSDGVTIEYEYDNQNRLSHEAVDDTRWINYFYDYEDGDACVSEKVNSIVASTEVGDLSTRLEFDKLERVTGKYVEFDVSSYGNNYIDYLYEYETNTIDNEICTSDRVKKVTTIVARNNRDNQDFVAYTQELVYDNNGNIQTVSDSEKGTNVYTYDGRNRLTQEENTALNRKYVYTYNDGGNITSKKEYNKSTGALLKTYAYGYNNDRLTSFDGNTITYDACGNPLTYKGNTLTWERGRLLSQYGNVTFQYDGEGFRRKKVVGNDTAIYYYQDGKLLSEKHIDPSKNISFIYHGNEVVGFITENVEMKYLEGYYYQKDVFGNVIAVYDLAGDKVASYTYDAWGNCTIGINVNGMAELNPIRYRGYYYDKETNLYYLQTRYYDPATGRFISPDTVNYLDPETIHGLNLYAYGLNNPVMYVDPTGHAALSLGVAIAIAAVIGGIVGATSSAMNQAIAYGENEINPWQVAMDGAFGAISGALSMFAPMGVQLGVNLFLDIFSYAVDGGIHGLEPTGYGVLSTISLSILSSLIGDDGLFFERSHSIVRADKVLRVIGGMSERELVATLIKDSSIATAVNALIILLEDPINKLIDWLRGIFY